MDLALLGPFSKNPKGATAVGTGTDNRRNLYHHAPNLFVRRRLVQVPEALARAKRAADHLQLERLRAFAMATSQELPDQRRLHLKVQASRCIGAAGTGVHA